MKGTSDLKCGCEKGCCFAGSICPCPCHTQNKSYKEITEDAGFKLSTQEIQDWKELIAKELTHREDGKKPHLHPNSMWNVKLIFLIEKILKDQEARHKRDMIESIKNDVKELFKTEIKDGIKNGLFLLDEKGVLNILNKYAI